MNKKCDIILCFYEKQLETHRKFLNRESNYFKTLLDKVESCNFNYKIKIDMSNILYNVSTNEKEIPRKFSLLLEIHYNPSFILSRNNVCNIFEISSIFEFEEFRKKSEEFLLKEPFNLELVSELSLIDDNLLTNKIIEKVDSWGKTKINLLNIGSVIPHNKIIIHSLRNLEKNASSQDDKDESSELIKRIHEDDLDFISKKQKPESKEIKETDSKVIKEKLTKYQAHNLISQFFGFYAKNNIQKMKSVHVYQTTLYNEFINFFDKKNVHLDVNIELFSKIIEEIIGYGMKQMKSINGIENSWLFESREKILTCIQKSFQTK
jgi:hypothetical protein